MTRRFILLVSCLAVLASQPALAATVDVVWRANSEADLAGYRIYYGTSARAVQAYAQTVLIQDKTLTRWSLDLVPGTYYFAMTAFDTDSNESDYSAEVMVEVTQPAVPGKPGKPIILP